jgi:hypothetical protein
LYVVSTEFAAAALPVVVTTVRAAEAATVIAAISGQIAESGGFESGDEPVEQIGQARSAAEAAPVGAAGQVGAEQHLPGVARGGQTGEQVHDLRVGPVLCPAGHVEAEEGTSRGQFCQADRIGVVVDVAEHDRPGADAFGREGV